MSAKKPEAKLVKAADMMIARRADTRARADFATWKMIAKLNGASSLSAEAQTFLTSYNALLKEMSEGEATEATIREMYKTYYAQMGGGGAPPEVRTGPSDPVTYRGRSGSRASASSAASRASRAAAALISSTHGSRP